jgi:hypothetical protein
MIRYKKKKGGGKKEEAEKLPLVTSWVPELNSNGVVFEGEGEMDNAIPFYLYSFADQTLAYYLAPGDAVSYRVTDYGVEPASLQVLTKGILETWECDGKDCEGTVAYGGKFANITEFEVHPDQEWKQLRSGMVVQFEINENLFIKKGSLDLAVPIVKELPDEKRRRIKETFDKINEGGLAKQGVSRNSHLEVHQVRKTELRQVGAAQQDN